MTEAVAFLKQVHEAFPELMHDCYDAHCTYGVVKRVITEKLVRVSGYLGWLDFFESTTLAYKHASLDRSAGCPSTGIVSW